DATLRALARQRPSTRDKIRAIYGIGEKKLQDWGDLFLDLIVSYSREHHLTLDQRPALSESTEAKRRYVARPGSAPPRPFTLFRQGSRLEDVVREIQVSPRTAAAYLSDFILRERPASITRWVPDEL